MKESINRDREADCAVLRKTLLSQGIDLSLWGKSPAKTIEDLFAEIEQGEASLSEEEGKLMRSVQVANLSVFHKTKDGESFRLEETAEEFPNGTIKKRNRIVGTSLSETMRKGEDFEIAAKRGLAEELGITSAYPIEHLSGDTEVKTSPSYPGLKTKYAFSIGRVFLSKEDYVPEGYKEVDQASGVITHFSWVRIEEDL